MDAEGELHALGSAEEISLPQTFALLQNFPNPFNASTAIEYQLPEALEVEVIVYDLLGQEVRRLMDGKVEAGCHSVLWDGRDSSGRDVASGIYLYRLQALMGPGREDFTQTRRMIFLR